jgi:hypothetical protein
MIKTSDYRNAIGYQYIIANCAIAFDMDMLADINLPANGYPVGRPQS